MAHLRRLRQQTSPPRTLIIHTNWHKVAINDRPPQIEVPLNGIEVVAVTVQCRRDTCCRPEGVGEGRERVRPAGVRRDASIGEEGVSGQGLEQPDDGLEERDGLGPPRAPRRKAGGMEGAVARSVGAPFVLARHQVR